jgi:heme/copper-type cytochrome/quinol oxidase subunit 1
MNIFSDSLVTQKFILLFCQVLVLLVIQYHLTHKPIFGALGMIYAMMSIGILGFIV